MQASNIPTKFQKIWGASAGGSYIRTIPVASQIGITNGAASFTDGFPPYCFYPVSAGGVPPFGQDFNGILQALSAWNQWAQAGAPLAYDATFQSEIGGYPKGAILLSATTAGLYWESTVDNNASNPDAGGAGWVRAYALMSQSTLSASGEKRWVDPNSPSGLFIIKWGAVDTGYGIGITFPTPFPTNALSVTISESAAGPSTWAEGLPTLHATSSLTATGFQHWTLSWNGTGWVNAANSGNYLAIGY